VNDEASSFLFFGDFSFPKLLALNHQRRRGRFVPHVVACTGLAMIGLNFLDDRRRASEAGSREPGLAYLDAA
jgi:hypothetical protein